MSLWVFIEQKTPEIEINLSLTWLWVSSKSQLDFAVHKDPQAQNLTIEWLSSTSAIETGYCEATELMKAF